MTGEIDPKARKVRCPKCLRVLPEPPDVLVYECGGCGARLQAKKRNKSIVDTASQRSDEDSSGKQKEARVIVDQEAASSSNIQSLLNSTNELDQNSDHNDHHSSNKDQDAANIAENGTVDAPACGVEEHLSERLKIQGLSDNQEPCSSLNQESVINSSDEPGQNIHSDPRSSTEFSGHEDPESSPEDTAHNRIDQEQEQDQKQKHDQSHYQESVAAVRKQKIEQLSDDNETSSRMTQQLLVNSVNELARDNDPNEYGSSSKLSYHDDPESSPEATIHNGIKRHETEFVSCRNDTEIEDSSSEFEATANTKIISDSDGGSKSSFRSIIAEKLLDTRQKKAMYLNEDDILSEDGSTDLHHRRRFSRISSVETMETARYGGTSYYGYEGSVSSFDGNENQNPRKHHIDSIGDEHIDSGSSYRFNRRYEFNPLNEFHENPRHHHSPVISENPKMERIQLLKLVRELQDQLERTKISNLQQAPSYYDHVLNIPGGYGRRMAFSGEATVVNRRRDGSSCHRCCPQDHRSSAQLSRHHVCCNGPVYRPNYEPSYGPSTYHSPHFSGPSSPKQNYSESEFCASNDHRQRSDVTKKKQYVRPIAGGSPWITCYLCYKLLQLPQSFLLFNKRYHSVRCGACLKVLNFTLSNGTHVSRYYPEETIAAPPSSEVEDNDKLNGPWAGPVSCSDRSFEKSYSTETDRNGSRELSDERRKVTMSRDPSGSTRPSSSKTSGRRKTASEIKEVEPGSNGSPLHWLMGYASPSKVIRG